jgi:hypothetical protein
VYTKEKQDYFVIENIERPEIPADIVLYAVLDSKDFGTSINLNAVETNSNNAGQVFALNRNGLLNKIEALTAKYKYIVFNDQAGVKELQFKQRPTPYSILDKYYVN